MNRLQLTVLALLLFVSSPLKGDDVQIPVIKDGEAQVIKELEDSDYWIRHDLWVETEFDLDGDGKMDRMHVSVTRPTQTETQSLKLPVIYNSSPYFAGTTGGDDSYFWDARQELGEEPPERSSAPKIEREGTR
ncbi:x-prolyl-dipeptidyl aminopeptidase, partial [Rhodopirellula sallentina SM41]